MNINLKKIWGVIHTGYTAKKNPNAKAEALRQCFGYALNFIEQMEKCKSNDYIAADFHSAAEMTFLKTLQEALEKSYPQDLILKVLNEKKNKRLKSLFRYVFETTLPEAKEIEAAKAFSQKEFDERNAHPRW